MHLNFMKKNAENFIIWPTDWSVGWCYIAFCIKCHVTKKQENFNLQQKPTMFGVLWLLPAGEDNTAPFPLERSLELLLTCRRPVKPPGTGCKPSSLPNADAALGGGACRRHVGSQQSSSRGGGKGGEEGRGQEWHLFSQCGGKEAGLSLWGPAGPKQQGGTSHEEELVCKGCH